jgi:AAA family ATP:ADP antiporter
VLGSARLLRATTIESMSLGTPLDRLLGVGARDHRDALVGFSTLLVAMTAHAVLETARDALFLTRLSPTRLPWAYLAIALLTLAAAEIPRRVRWRISRRHALSATLLAGAFVTVAVAATAWWIDSRRATFTFYVWTGLLATTVVVQFWLLAGELFDFGQAKRVFALIGGGGLVGAMLGSLLASGALLFLSPHWLPFIAAALLAIAAILPLLFTERRPAEQRAPDVPNRFELGALRKDTYLQRLLTLSLLATLAVTIGDYIFKSTVAREVARERLGDFFGRYYAAINGSALIVQLLLAPWLLRRAGVHRAVQLMPIVLLTATLGFVAAPGLIAVMLLKASDGTLRHSVNRVSSELLYLPLTQAVRDRFRVLTEAFGLRLGQALASLAVLGALALDFEITTLAWILVGLCAAWLLMACIRLENLYVARFRSELRRGTLRHRARVADLDARSIEALSAALGSKDDAEVIAALDVFETYAQAQLIPALILYHPSPRVVVRALEVLETTRREDLVPIAARLLTHPDQQVRAALLRLYVSAEPDPDTLRQLLNDEDEAVRATALVGLIHVGAVQQPEAERQLAQILGASSVPARQALALALPLLPASNYAWVATALAATDDAVTARLLAHAIATAPHVQLVAAAIRILPHRDARPGARRALAALGEPALDVLERALDDVTLPVAIRRHLPRTISRFASARAASILERRLRREADDVVGYKILRGLAQMRSDNPELPVDAQALSWLALRTIQDALTTSALAYVLDNVRRRIPGADSAGAELLSAALSDQTERAVERAFRLMHIIEPTQDLEIVHRALKSRDLDVRARGRELAEHMLPERLRWRVLALFADETETDDRRLRAARRFALPADVRRALKLVAELERATPARHAELERRVRAAVAAGLGHLLESDNSALSAIAAHHLAERGNVRAERVADRSAQKDEMAHVH